MKFSCLLFCFLFSFCFVFFEPDRASAADPFTIIYMDAMDKGGRSSDEAYWIAQAIYYACGRYGVDPLLAAAIMRAESCYDFSSYSSAGAVGLMQLMPSTAEIIGVNPYDPLQNVIGGIAHLRTLLDSFAGWGAYAVSYAVAAYNAGAQAILDYNGFPPYSETNQYVVAVSENYNYFLSLYTPSDTNEEGESYVG